MDKVYVRVGDKPFRRHQPGEVIHISRRDAKLLTALGTVQALDGQPVDDEQPKAAPKARTTPAKRTSTPRKRKAK